MKPIIALTKNQNRYQSISNSLNLIKSQIAKGIKNKKRVVIKVNFVTADSQLAATHVDAVRALLDFLKPIYKKRIIITERGAVNPGQGFKNYSYQPLLKNYNIALEDYTKYGFKEIKLFNAGLQKTQKNYFSSLALESDFLISITPAKTHDCAIVTLGLKNITVGFLKNAPLIHQGYQAFNKNIFVLVNLKKPDLNLIDGTISMEGDGPSLGTPKKTNWTLASLDSIQADVIASRLMGFNPEKIGYLHYCLKENLATDDPKEVKILGSNFKDCITKFKPHHAYRDQLKWDQSPTVKEKIRSTIIAHLSNFSTNNKTGQIIKNSPFGNIIKRLLGFQ